MSDQNPDNGDQPPLSDFGDTASESEEAAMTMFEEQPETMNEAALVEYLRRQAVADDWHRFQGKGRAGRVEQDLLAHTMDVLHIVQNFLTEIDPDLEISQKGVLIAAFLHDLHKRPEVGGTESMTTEEVEEFVERWDLRAAITADYSLSAFTDILRSIHRYTGDNDARGRVAADPDLLYVTQIVRFADSIASVDELDELYQSGQRDTTDIVAGLNAGLDEEYALGYHELSEVRSALSVLLHEALYDSLTERDAIMLATRADAAIYLFPVEMDLTGVADEVVEYIRETFVRPAIQSAIPEKTQEGLYDIDTTIELRADAHRDRLDREGGTVDLTDEYQRLFDVEYPVEVGDVEFLEVDHDEEIIRVASPASQRGSIIGSLVGNLISALHSDGIDIDGRSRLETLEALLEPEIDLGRFDDLAWNTVEAQLAMVVGNHVFEQDEQTPEALIDTIADRAKAIATDETESALDPGRLQDYVREVVAISVWRDGAEQRPLRTALPSEISVGLDYSDACVLCGSRAAFDFRTSRSGPLKKSYMTRGVAGRESAGDWRLCAECFIDNTLFRALLEETDQLYDAEAMLFLQVLPNRYLGPRQANLIRTRVRDGFDSTTADAERYLSTEHGYESDEPAASGFATEQEGFEADYRVTFDEHPSVESLGLVVNSPHHFLIGVQHYDPDTENEESKTTITWLKAIFRSLLLYRYHNVNVVIGGTPTVDQSLTAPGTAGVRLTNPPSQIRSVFGDRIEYHEVDAVLEGLANLIHATSELPQFSGINDLNQPYGTLRSSPYPGSRLYRAAERELDSEYDAGVIDDIEAICTALDEWKATVEMIDQ